MLISRFKALCCLVAHVLLMAMALPAVAQPTAAAAAAASAPQRVTIGAYVNKIQDVSFRDNRYAADFYLWFRWKPEGVLKNYKPLESFELINGKIDSKTSAVEKDIGDMRYAPVRVGATINENWNLRAFPFDGHKLKIHVEDSQFFAKDLAFVSDSVNSRLGEEINLAGWSVNNFLSEVTTKLYKTNYGDTTLPTDALSEYSRFTVGLDLFRSSFGTALKLLTTVFAATAVAFVAFMVKPSDLDPRFGLGVGALFAVAASAFVVSSSVPDSGVMTVADQIHMIAMGFIFASLLQSALALKYEVSGREELSVKLDRWSLAVFPILFTIWSFLIIRGGFRFVD